MNTPRSTHGVLDAALDNATRSLLAGRTADVHWEGGLSSSALSTATALFALSLHGSGREQVAAGIAWLLEHQNADGGWGDTTLSFSNISTTALCWAALTVAGEGAAAAVAAAEAWLARAAGSLEPDAIARAIAARYGKDRTFSVPILTMCALAGRLGADREAWRRVTQLPFELAAFPQSWFRFFRLPVVSYALPALISMGLARHHRRPSRNPITRLLRRLTVSRVLRVLAEIQPTGGGFLEATPLTSFVVMSMIGAGRRDHAVVTGGVGFLIRSARADGSWPIDTNLATWVTTLSVNALAGRGGPAAVERVLSKVERARLRDWLLVQQYRSVHRYTGAPPGAWAWTDLPGGVPDADDTAGALLALHNLGDIDDRVTEAAASAVGWLLDLQNRDGGIPTFCRGWTNLPFDRSGADLTAHALLAWSAWRDRMPHKLAERMDVARARAVRFLINVQRPDGSWLPLWFGNQSMADDENPTYGTAKVLAALCGETGAETAVKRGVNWLIGAQNTDGGWGGGQGTSSTIEETALAVDALAHDRTTTDDPIVQAIHRGVAWLIERTQAGTQFQFSPIGFYFAKLWYYERAYPALFTVGALGRVASLAASRVTPAPC
jgi:squalene-hopene/tetraprenyl-beta-curcumene cyclase